MRLIPAAYQALQTMMTACPNGTSQHNWAPGYQSGCMTPRCLGTAHDGEKKFYHHWRLLKGEAQSSVACHYLCLYQE